MCKLLTSDWSASCAFVSAHSMRNDGLRDLSMYTDTLPLNLFKRQYNYYNCICRGKNQERTLRQIAGLVTQALP